MSGIVHGGEGRYLEGLARDERLALERLQSLLSTETDPRRRDAIQREIEQISREHAEKRRQARFGLY